MTSLRDTDLTLSLPKKLYKKRLKKCSEKLVQLQHDLLKARIPSILVFEGWDASGKGGAIKSLLEHLDPRGYQVHSTAAPTQEELDHHYLWRFWKYLPQRGRMAIFDRSWYGRVMVERIEGFATEREWKRAFEEINQFEKVLADDGYLIIKFFLNISKDEQKERLADRAKDPLKSWKLTPEDYRNRRKWDQYTVAVNDMLAKTHSSFAPWHVIPANDKYFARISVQDICISTFKRRLVAAGK